MRSTPYLLFGALTAIGSITRPCLAQVGNGSVSVEFFEKSIRPLLVHNCLSCHSGATARGGLNLDNAAGPRKGGSLGAAVVPGSPERSLLLRALRHAAGVPAMPPGSKLPDSQITAVERWIKLGAVDPRNGAVPDKSTKRAGWALQPIKHVPIPSISGTSPFNPIDRFILAKLQHAGIKPSAMADRRTLIRRATYDLTGLPPTPQEVSAFLDDRNPSAYSRLVDRLLESPRYGERWGRHWLDVVHYGDTHGYDKDKRRDHAWPYRDYVIDSFNRDTPYGRFIREQVAGDILYPKDPRATIATGMLAAGPWDFVGNVELGEGTVEKEKTRLIDRDDIVATVISTFQSVTIHCARCHDHKFDPIPQRDYYRLQAVFAGIERGDRPYYDAEHMLQGERLQVAKAGAQHQLDAATAQISKITSPEIERIDARIQDVSNKTPAAPPPAAPQPSPSNGYHSDICKMQDTTRWVQVDLGRVRPIQLVRLIPARPTDFADTPGFGFPVRYKITASNTPDFANEQVITDRTTTDFPNPGDSPVLAPASFDARYVRVTATKLWLRTNDYVFALGEM